MKKINIELTQATPKGALRTVMLQMKKEFTAAISEIQCAIEDLEDAVYGTEEVPEPVAEPAPVEASPEPAPSAETD